MEAGESCSQIESTSSENEGSNSNAMWASSVRESDDECSESKNALKSLNQYLFQDLEQGDDLLCNFETVDLERFNHLVAEAGLAQPETVTTNVDIEKLQYLELESLEGHTQYHFDGNELGDFDEEMISSLASLDEGIDCKNTAGSWVHNDAETTVAKTLLKIIVDFYGSCFVKSTYVSRIL